MFDVGFTELVLVGVVALIVVGPEKLPNVIRTMLSYIRQFKAGFAQIKSDVERELELSELKSTLDDSKEQVSKAIGYDELHQSLDELRQESQHLQAAVGDKIDSLDDAHLRYHPDDDDIEADLQTLAENSKHLPDPDAEADTGAEDDVGPPRRQS